MGTQCVGESSNGSKPKTQKHFKYSEQYFSVISVMYILMSPTITRFEFSLLKNSIWNQVHHIKV